MIRLGVIGLGTIFSVQCKTLARLNDLYQVTAVCDVLPEKRRRFEQQLVEVLPGTRPSVYSKSTEVFADHRVDAVLIATPPSTHYALTLEGLEHGKSILLEKPAVLKPEQLDSLYTVAKEQHCLLHIAYHASFAKDLEWFLERSSKLALGNITQIECGFYDPYMENGGVLPGKTPLGGCFIDSGVNALSVCARLTDLTGSCLVHKKEQVTKEASELVYHADHVFEKGSCRVVIHTGWDLGLDQKTTTLSFSDTNKKILLDHSNQSVFLLSPGQRQELYRYTETERLLTHYNGVFHDFAVAFRTASSNEEISRVIHQLLLWEQPVPPSWRSKIAYI